MSSTRDIFKARFHVNMRRISLLIGVVLSDKREPIGLTTYQDDRADILRFSVVFLHATFETLVRALTHRSNRKWCFYSKTDINKALERSSLSCKPFESLYPALTALAKRRKRIVHDADFVKSTDVEVENWTITDHWQLIMWNLAVLAFFHRLLIAMKAASEVEFEISKRLDAAMQEHIDFGHQLSNFPKVPPDDRDVSLGKIIATAESMLKMLSLDDTV